MQALINQIRARPSLFVLAGTVSLTIVGGMWFSGYKASKDPQLVYNSREDPYPYLRVRDNKPPMFSKVSEEVEKDIEEHYDLLDILNGKYGDT